MDCDKLMADTEAARRDVERLLAASSLMLGTLSSRAAYQLALVRQSLRFAQTALECARSAIGHMVPADFQNLNT